MWQGTPLHGANCPQVAQTVRSCTECTSPCLKVFIARLVADTPRKPAMAQMPKLIAQKMPNVYPAPAIGLSQVMRMYRFLSLTVRPTTYYRQLQESCNACVEHCWLLSTAKLTMPIFELVDHGEAASTPVSHDWRGNGNPATQNGLECCPQEVPPPPEHSCTSQCLGTGDRPS